MNVIGWDATYYAAFVVAGVGECGAAKPRAPRPWLMPVQLPISTIVNVVIIHGVRHPVKPCVQVSLHTSAARAGTPVCIWGKLLAAEEYCPGYKMLYATAKRTTHAYRIVVHPHPPTGVADAS